MANFDSQLGWTEKAHFWCISESAYRGDWPVGQQLRRVAYPEYGQQHLIGWGP